MPSPRFFLALMLLASSSVNAAESKMLDKVKTYCFGRYLVDVPYEAELKGQGNAYMISSVKIEKISKEKLLQRVREKESTLKSEKDPYEDQYVETRLSTSTDKRLVLAKSIPFGRSMYSVDTYKFLGNGYSALTSDRALNKDFIQSTISDFEHYLQQIHYRSDREIPTTAGFCIENGFIANDGKMPHFERASITFSLKNNPDVWFSVESFVLSKSQSSLLIRIKESKIDARFPGKIKRVREGKLTINGMMGEESLVHFPSDDGKGEAQSFTWEAQGEIANPLKPNIELAITSGEGVAGVTGASSMSTKQIQALYEAIVKTIRLRPTTETR